MKMDKVAGSKNDEFYTPKYAIRPIMKYIPKNSKIWCPFDTEDSNYVKLLKEAGHTVMYTHISNGEDFFNLEPAEDYDYIISNPPYSKKTEVLERLFTLGKPFAMLVGVVGLFESKKRFEMFRDNNFEIMYLNKRVSYLSSYDFEKDFTMLNPPFSSVYICRNVLPKQIVFEDINKKEL